MLIKFRLRVSTHSKPKSSHILNNVITGKKVYFTLNKEQSIHTSFGSMVLELLASKHQKLCLVDESIISHYKKQKILEKLYLH